jgi:hypothetical protein
MGVPSLLDDTWIRRIVVGDASAFAFTATVQTTAAQNVRDTRDIVETPGVFRPRLSISGQL